MRTVGIAALGPPPAGGSSPRTEDPAVAAIASALVARLPQASEVSPRAGSWRSSGVPSFAAASSCGDNVALDEPADHQSSKDRLPTTAAAPLLLSAAASMWTPSPPSSALALSQRQARRAPPRGGGAGAFAQKRPPTSGAGARSDDGGALGSPKSAGPGGGGQASPSRRPAAAVAEACSGSAWDDAAAASRTEEEASLRSKLASCEELIRQLKGIVKAQHSKIQELRERVDYGPDFNIVELMTKREKGDFEKLQQENEGNRQQLASLKADLQKFRKDNDTLRKANRRLKAMLHGGEGSQGGGGDAGSGGLSMTSELSGLPPAGGSVGPSLTPSPLPSLRPGIPGGGGASGVGLGGASPQGGGPGGGGSGGTVVRFMNHVMEERAPGKSPRCFEDSQDSPPASPRYGDFYLSAGASADMSRVPSERRGVVVEAPEIPATVARSLNRRDTLGRGSIIGGPTFSRLSRLLSALPALYRESDTASGVLTALGDVCMRMLGDFQNLIVTVYAADEWLRAEIKSEQDSVTSPSLFYLNQGKMHLQAFGGRGGGQSQPPCFPGSQALPFFSRTGIAGVGAVKDRQFVVVQAQLAVDEGPESDVPDIIKKRRQSVTSAKSGDQENGFSETAKDYLQLLCQVAGGLLLQIERSRARQKSQGRTQACLEIATEVNLSRSLQDFEQRVKHLIGTFFNVSSVRVLFYYEVNQSLLQTSAATGQEPLAFSITKGVVGMAAKKRQLIHVPNIGQNAFVDFHADGIQRSGRPMGAGAAMLVGPLLLEGVSGMGGEAQLLGVLQCMDRRPKTAATQATRGGASGRGTGLEAGPPPSGEFTAEELALFSQLSRILSVVLWRTWKVQEQAAQLDGIPCLLPKILSGK